MIELIAKMLPQMLAAAAQKGAQTDGDAQRMFPQMGAQTEGDAQRQAGLTMQPTLPGAPALLQAPPQAQGGGGGSKADIMKMIMMMAGGG